MAASGWHTAAMSMKLFVTGKLKLAGGSIGLGVDELRWPQPVRPGDILKVETEILDVRKSRSKPDRGIILCPLEIGPLPLSFRHDGDLMHYDGNYHQRPRIAGSDVDVCFAGNIAVTKIALGVVPYHQLTIEDFEGPAGPGNPLATVLRAMRDDLATLGAAGGSQGEPYPLLIVRPDGIELFYGARAAMESWASEFGYELVEQDRKLVYPAPNSQLARVEQTALADARARCAWFAQTRTARKLS